MTRKIKFRAWDKEAKKMISADMADGYDGLFVYFSGGVGSIDFGCPDGGIGGSNVELMQFTGLLDQNGKEIYEGDVVQEVNENGAFLYRVFWEKYDCAFYLAPVFVKDKELDKNGNMLTRMSSLYTEVEVVGNIYQNPELLK